MADLDRDELLAALAQLDDSDDATAADAARRASRLLSSAGLSWSDVIVEAPAITLTDEPAAAETGDSAMEGDRATSTDDALTLIDRLLARDSLYEGTRDDLLAYKQDIAEGEFDDSDLAYLNALYARVVSGKSKGGG